MDQKEIVISIIKSNPGIDIKKLNALSGISINTLSSILERLKQEGYIEFNKAERKRYYLTDEGRSYLDGLPEEKLVRSIDEFIETKSADPVAVQWAKRNGWIAIKDGKIFLTKIAEEYKRDGSYILRDILNRLDDESFIKDKEEYISILKKRGLIRETTETEISNIRVIKDYSKESYITSLTREIILNKEWLNKDFKRYDIDQEVEAVYPAREHPVHEFINIIKQIFLSMGFIEVNGPIVETAFWNFDVLFEPQDHPAREMQDTFYIKGPISLSIDDVALVERVKSMHKKGWRYEWKEDMAKRALLRTQATAISARHLYKIAKDLSYSDPIKMFSVARVFRNENIDFNHLAEFHQIDGIIVGNDLNFANLLYILKSFYENLGIKNISFKPAYFPFVEPGLEINYYNERFNTTIELGGAGIIRKEICRAVGIKNKKVLAFGLSIERLARDFLNLDSIWQLYRNNIQFLRDRPFFDL
ncbi:MAG: phenylalanine--tRNA ligase alpha subunit [Candidatus Micrarchaeota archaeon]|nr:MAG: phenylalanine--tRNA ligase alpha subunit [Candidatus Micrarchaeota archaeon]